MTQWTAKITMAAKTSNPGYGWTKVCLIVAAVTAHDPDATNAALSAYLASEQRQQLDALGV